MEAGEGGVLTFKTSKNGDEVGGMEDMEGPFQFQTTHGCAREVACCMALF